MKIRGMLLCRNEAWVLSCTIPAALKWVDDLYILDDDSTDGTPDLINQLQKEYPKRIKPYYWPHQEYWAEMDARQYLFEMADGASHYAIIDADEMLTANHLGNVRDWFSLLAPGQCIDVPMIAPWKRLEEYSTATTGVITLGFCDIPGKLCWKPRGDEQYHHHSRPPHGSMQHRLTPMIGSDGGCFHLQWAAFDRMLWKHRAYCMTELLRWKYPVREINTKYHWWDKPPHGENLKPVPDAWYSGYNLRSIRLDHVPWYKSECERLVEKHGKEAFQGLDLFGWNPGA